MRWVPSLVFVSSLGSQQKSSDPGTNNNIPCSILLRNTPSPCQPRLRTAVKLTMPPRRRPRSCTVMPGTPCKPFLSAVATLAIAVLIVSMPTSTASWAATPKPTLTAGVEMGTVVSRQGVADSQHWLAVQGAGIQGA